MRRRRATSRKPVKAQPSIKGKRGAASKPARNRRHSVSKDTEVIRLARELAEAREQQAATSQVLQIISSSPGELKPVFQAMLANAVRLCEAKFGTLYLYESGAFRMVATHDTPPAYNEARRRGPIIPQPGSGGALAELIGTKRTAHVTDLAATQGYAERNPHFVDAVELGGVRTTVDVPMLKDNELIGAIAIFRQEVRPFTDKQIGLLSNFAAQAVIAIENARLFEAEQKRSKELSEALQQQTATSEVLRVISSSPGDLAAVFNAMLANATRLCEASYGLMLLREEDDFRSAAVHGPLPQAFIERWQPGTLIRADPDLPGGRAAQTRQTVQIGDLRATPGYLRGDAFPVSLADVAGIRTIVAVPMLKDNRPIGVMAIYRREVRPFTAKHIELVQNFASQAVIAIENTRLLNELCESLQQQTATADVLKV